jgi:cholera toxin transcriptional activator
VDHANRQRQLFRFGTFELDSGTGELRKDGRACPRLRDQALQILILLLEKSEDLVTREELRERLWPADTFVDFDHGLNTAVNQIRNSLGDSASNPKFVQTLPRKGYRFIAPVRIVGEGISVAAGEGKREETAPPPGSLADSLVRQKRNRSILSDRTDLPVVASGVVRILFALIQIMYLSFYIVGLARASSVERVLTTLVEHAFPVFVVLVITASAGIPVRLYLLTATAFNYQGLDTKFRKLFPFVLVLDEIWALTPFLLVQQIGAGLAMGVTAALLYLPFSQRSLLLMGSKSRLRHE